MMSDLWYGTVGMCMLVWRMCEIVCVFICKHRITPMQSSMYAYAGMCTVTRWSEHVSAIANIVHKHACGDTHNHHIFRASVEDRGGYRNRVCECVCAPHTIRRRPVDRSGSDADGHLRTTAPGGTYRLPTNNRHACVLR